MIFLTTTAIEIDEELLNRCLVLTVDEGREQTRAIHARQREAQTLEGLLARQERQRDPRGCTRTRSGCSGRCSVVNPFARELTLSGPRDADAARSREVPDADRHDRAAAPAPAAGEDGGAPGRRSCEYIEVTREDIALANRLAHEVLGRTLDELPPQTRRLLGLLDELVTERAVRRRGIDRATSASAAGRCASGRAGATRSSRCTWGGSWSSSTWSCTAGGRASGFVLRARVRAERQRTASRFCRG